MTSLRLIEELFPVAAISQSCSHEKSIRQGHLSTLQTWWARRPLAVCRAAVLLSMLPSIKVIESDTTMVALINSYAPGPGRLADKLLKFTADLSSFGNSNDPRLLGLARQLIALSRNDAALVDTFGGGGSIPLESLRLGVDTYASDLNPIAASGLSLALEAAPGMSDAAMTRLKADVVAIADNLQDHLKTTYPDDDVLAYFWCRTYSCVDCGREAPLFQNMWLSKKRIPTAIKIQKTHESGEIVFSIISPKSPSELADAERGTMDGRNAYCVFCNEKTSMSDLQKQGMDGRLGELLYAKCIKTKTGKQYTPIDADQAFSALGMQDYSASDLDLNLNLDMNGVRHLWAMQYGVRTISDLFNPRQRAAIHAIHNAIYCQKETIEATSESNAEKKFRLLSLVMIMNKVTVYSNRHSWWQSNGEFPANIFVRQAISMVWNYVEIPPSSTGAGGWKSSSNWVLKALDHIRQIERTAEVRCVDAAASKLASGSVDVVMIDPPYFDAITYAYLSDFFYPWMKNLLRKDFPSWFNNVSTPKTEELIVDRSHKLAPSPKSSTFFSTKMTECLREAARLLKADGLIVVMYGHKDIKAWIALFSAISSAGLRVTTSWPVHTERNSKFKHSKVDALAVSCLLTLRKADDISRSTSTISVTEFTQRSKDAAAKIRRDHPELLDDPVGLSMAAFPLILDDFYNHNITPNIDGTAFTIQELRKLVGV